MSVKITYFVHGTTTDNEKGLATGWNPGELSGRGIRESEELGVIVKDTHFDVVFCSDLKRAIDTAQLAFGNKYKIIQDKRLREADYGDYNGKENNFKDNLNDYIDKPFPNGESYKDVEERINDFIKDLNIKYNNKHVAIISHHAPQLALEVICNINMKSWHDAIAEDWRKVGKWQPGWKYQTPIFERK